MPDKRDHARHRVASSSCEARIRRFWNEEEASELHAIFLGEGGFVGHKGRQDIRRDWRVGLGFELLQKSPGNTEIRGVGAANCGAVELLAHFAQIAAVWPRLSSEDRCLILAFAKRAAEFG